MKKEKWLIALAAGAGVAAAVGACYLLFKNDIPENAVAVQPFDIKKYLGLWHEVARMPSAIEKNLTQLTEDYSQNEDGSVKVITKAFNTKSNQWDEQSGHIKFAGADDVGMLKVSYFGPFYANYNVLDIDADYNYALVSGSGLSYLWILSRETTVPNNIKLRFLNKANEIGFKIDELEWV